MEFRTEKDALGEKQVPCEAYYGIHSLRGFENFQISGKTLPIEMFHAIAEIKIACAKANTELGLLDEKICSVIVKAGEDVLKGDFDKEFVIDAYQAGAGTPTHMNVNEVMANIGIEKLGGIKGEYKIVHPNDHVNMSQSSNDVFPTAMHISIALKTEKELLPALENIHRSFAKKAKDWAHIVKIGRTHMQDAVPITIGQEFEAYGASIRRSIDDLKFVGENILELNVGKNAIGTGINTHPELLNYIECIYGAMDDSRVNGPSYDNTYWANKKCIYLKNIKNMYSEKSILRIHQGIFK